MEQNMDNQNNNQGTDQNRKVVTIAGVILLVVVLGALLATGRLGERAPKGEEVAVQENALPEGCEPGYEFNILTGEPCPEPESEEDNNNASASDELESSSYDDVLKEYTGRVVLLGESCEPVINTQTFTEGTRVLVANHSTKAVDVSLNGREENLDPYHYMTVSLKTVGEFNVSCDGEDVATVAVTAK